MDTEIIAIASTLEKAEELAVGYTCDVFRDQIGEDTKAVVDFSEWLSTGYVVEDKDDDERCSRITIEAHELQ